MGTADRQVTPYTGSNTIKGYEVVNEVNDELGALYKNSFLTLTNVVVTLIVSPSSTEIEATIVPPLSGALEDGMKFSLRMGGNANTGTTELKIDGTFRPLVRHDGSQTQDSDLQANAVVPLEFKSADSSFYMMYPPRASTGATLNYQSFTASGTWTKPSGLADNALVLVEGWAGGGGGSSTSGQGGGGGGGYARALFRGSQLGSTETVTIGAGGAAGSAGGNTTFGSLLTAYGGGTTSGSGGAGGGGALAKGSNATTTAGAAGGGPSGGAGGSSAVGGDSTMGGAGGGGGAFGTGGASYYGGGGGSGGGGSAAGGASVFGGGGGAGGGGAGVGGTSAFGGAGGANGAAGSAPGGGGGATGAGARGECRVLVIG